MRILLLYYEPQASGQTTHVLSLARGLVERGHDISVVLPEKLACPAEAFRQLGVQTVPLPLRKVLWGLQSILSLNRLVRLSGFDVVHVHSQEAGITARLVSRWARAEVIFYTPQTIDIRRAKWHGLYTTMERVLARTTDVIISVNEADRARMIGWGIPASKIVTVPNGIDLTGLGGPADAGAIRASLGLHRARPLVMQVGRLSAQKDPLAFVEGAARVVMDVPDAQFALIGEGPLAEAVTARISELGLFGSVLPLGWRDGASRLMAAADVVTLTSRWEGTPHTLLEAMAWSKPVVAMDVNGCSEAVDDGQTGLLVQPGDIAAWSQSVSELLQTPDRAARLGRAGRKRVEERFALQQMVVCIEGLYEQAAHS